MANYTAHYHLHQWEPEDSFYGETSTRIFRKLTRASPDGEIAAFCSALMWVRELAARPSLPYLHWGFQPRRFG